MQIPNKNPPGPAETRSLTTSLYCTAQEILNLSVMVVTRNAQPHGCMVTHRDQTAPKNWHDRGKRTIRRGISDLNMVIFHCMSTVMISSREKTVRLIKPSSVAMIVGKKYFKNKVRLNQFISSVWTSKLNLLNPSPVTGWPLKYSSWILDSQYPPPFFRCFEVWEVDT